MLFNRDTPLWQLGFRAFFILSSLYASLAIVLWLGIFFGRFPYTGYLPPVIWHSHEMIYGFTAAVIAGFMLTASQNWSGQRGVHGGKLQLLVGLWILGRVFILTFQQAHLMAALTDLAFYPVLGVSLFPYLKIKKLKSEKVFFLYFMVLFTGNLLVHLESFGLIEGYSLRAIHLGLNTTVLMMIFMGGRLIPFFTESSIARSQPQVNPYLEYLSHASGWGFIIASFFFSSSLGGAILAFLAACIHALRLIGWQVRRVRRVPLIWVLHLAYLWIVIGFFLSSFVFLGKLTTSITTHAFTAGAIGIITYGMMSRVSLGHTGRPLRPSCMIVTGYYLLNISAAFRVFGPLISNDAYSFTVLLSGCLWVVAFTLLFVDVLPILMSPRIDGKAG